ncbi:cysteine-rich and transmembrane domain-containing protein 1 [Rhinatrema bivittatum]|uniref:cysteine-rich and transmembrane domain-containing protein 1 n=1 Tax=Rhinatrema bivittatum TaxID=194408 RepID=UPI001126ABA7|nr:cysteine-rich and transmembrane domain-containing protein 1 [Rhinatrema bivittatum]
MRRESSASQEKGETAGAGREEGGAAAFSARNEVGSLDTPGPSVSYRPLLPVITPLPDPSARKHLLGFMNYENPPPYSGPGPSAPYPPYIQQPPGPGPNPYPGYPPGPAGPYPPGQPGYQGYPQYGWQNAPPGPVYAEAPKNTVYVVEERRRDDSGCLTCLSACWTALCCCCLWDMLT